VPRLQVLPELPEPAVGNAGVTEAEPGSSEQTGERAADGDAEQEPGDEPDRTARHDAVARGDLVRLFQLDPAGLGADDDGGVADRDALFGVQLAHRRERVFRGRDILERDREEGRRRVVHPAVSIASAVIELMLSWPIASSFESGALASTPMARLLWQQRQDIGPAARFGSPIVYMASLQKSVLWGGGSGFGDTWEWDGDGWVQVADTGPAPSTFVGLAFDSLRNVVVFFNSNATNTACETWEWDGEGWTQVEDTGPQAPNLGFEMVYDTARQVTILEGGSLANPAPTFPPVGTWAWDGTTWTQVADAGPRQRVLAALADDASRERVVHFGGQNRDGTYERDTWEWNGTVWEQVADIGPVPRHGHGMTGTAGASLLFGGVRSGGPPYELLRDTWTWDGEHWHQRQDMGPSPRAGHALTWDAARNRGVLFGGVILVASQETPVGDTWESFETP
jgi:hypothetical protein